MKDSKYIKSADEKLMDYLNKESKNLTERDFSRLKDSQNPDTLVQSILQDLNTVSQNNDYFSQYFSSADDTFEIKKLMEKGIYLLYSQALVAYENTSGFQKQNG